MKLNTINRLIDINREFYQTFASQFSATRQRLQPGVYKVIETLPAHARIIDIGCGNGHLWHTLKHKGFQGSYLGLDFSAGLLEKAIDGTPNLIVAGSGKEAEEILATGDPRGVFLQADLTRDDWWETLKPQSYDYAFLFAVLHHIPGTKLRERILSNIYRLLTLDGLFFLSNWQFLNSPKLKARIQPWHIVDLDEHLLDPGDYLLDWRAGGSGLRYVHQFDEGELTALAKTCRFEILDTFYSDGEAANLSLYQMWQRYRE